MVFSFASLLFATCSILVFYLIAPQLRPAVLLLSSLIYVFYLDIPTGIAVCLTALLSWGLGLVIGFLIQKKKTGLAKIVTALGIIATVSVLIAFKVLGYLSSVHEEQDRFLYNIVMPIGFSFYAFQVISYFADLLKGSCKAVKNPFRYLLYLVWFPKFVSGPIERSGEYQAQLAKIREVRLFEYSRWVEVTQYIALGVAMKLLIADRFSPYVDMLFSHHEGFSTSWLLIGMLMYSLQIYFDFAGYSFVAVGVSLAFGIRLRENFRLPYLSSNITEFWRRWHMSLSSWLKDYLYIPLGGNRKGEARKILNTLIVFTICGIWHGTGWTFLIWGLLHGVFTALDTILSGKGIQWIRSGIPGRILTFLGVTFAWLFFRAENLSMAGGYLHALFSTGFRLHSFHAEREVLDFSTTDLKLVILFLLCFRILEYLAYKKETNVPEMIAKCPMAIRLSYLFILLTAIIIFGIYGPAYDANALIYMQF